MSILNMFKKKDPYLDAVNQTVIIDAPLEIVGAQLSKWLEQTWRPAGSLLTLHGVDNLDLKIGAVYNAQFKYLLKAKWKLTVVRFEENNLLQSKLSGFFNGDETILIEQRDNGIKCSYKMTYELKNPIYQMMWSLLMEEKFVRNTDSILNAFKTECLK